MFVTFGSRKAEVARATFATSQDKEANSMGDLFNGDLIFNMPACCPVRGNCLNNIVSGFERKLHRASYELEIGMILRVRFVVR